LARTDRDPSWPTVRARLGGYPAGEIACDVTLSSLVAAQATGHALAFLDQGDVPTGTLDVSPGWKWHHRPLQPHPRCECGRKHFASLRMVA
jgi:hypothetical protein